MNLWSGSVDRSIRVWDMASARCLGSCSAANGGEGHAREITCMISFSASVTDTCVASASIDGEMKVWNKNGEFQFSCWHDAGVTVLSNFRDSHGGLLSVCLRCM